MTPKTTRLLECDLSEYLLPQNFPNQFVNRPGARHVHEWAPRIDAVVDPWWSLRTLLEKCSDADLPREMIGFTGISRQSHI